MKNFCQSLRQHAIEVINFKKKQTKLLANKQQNSYENAKHFHTCKDKIEHEQAKNKNYCKVRYHCHYAGEYKGAAHSIWYLKYSASKNISIIQHNRSNCDYHFTIKTLAEELEGQLSCTG